MRLNKMQSAATLLLAAGVTAVWGADKSAVSDAKLEGFVAQRLKEWRATAQERRFDEIGWVKDIREALRLAKKHGRPVFLFTHDGRMNIGRC